MIPRLPKKKPALFICVALAGALAGCGGGGSPTPSEPSGPKAGGTMSGRYTLQLTPAASCGGRAVSFSVEVTRTSSSPHPGAELLLSGVSPSPLELELKYTDDTLEGGVGIYDDGFSSAEGLPTWVNAIASGKTTQTSDGRGEVVSGTLRGYLEIEGVMNACTASNHTFSLRAK